MSPASFDADFYLRCMFSLITGFLLVAAGGPIAEKRYRRSPPSSVVIALFFARVLMFGAWFMLGAAAGVSLAGVLLAGNAAAPAILALATALAGVWSIAILSQILANLVRALLGLKPEKLELWRK